MYSQRPSRSKKILVGSLGILFGLSHLALIQSTVNRKSSLPLINLPVGPYTSYIASVTEKGYTIRYKSHSPKIIETEKHVDRPAGFLGIGKSEVKTYEQSVAGGGSGSVSESSELTAKADCMYQGRRLWRGYREACSSQYHCSYNSYSYRDTLCWMVSSWIL